MIEILALAVVLNTVSEGFRNQRDGETDLVWAAETFCFAADGNMARTWDRAEAEGYQMLRPSDFPNLRLPGARNLRGYSKRIGRVEMRVLTAETRFDGFNQGLNFFRMCWVSAEPADRSQIDQELSRSLGVSRFRQEDAYVYAWANAEDGSRREMRRREFMARGLRDALAEDMRFVLTNDRFGVVSITYMVPIEGFSEPRLTGSLGGQG